MGLFNIFKSEKRSEEENVTPKTIKSLSDILTIDFKNSPDDSYTKGESEENESGDLLTNYRKNLNPKELGLFDSLEIKVFENKGNKNFVFKGYDFRKSDISKVKQLVDNLFLIYGEDGSDLGKFKTEDDSNLRSEYWTGRMWTDEKHETPLMVSYDSEVGLSLTIWTK